MINAWLKERKQTTQRKKTFNINANRISLDLVKMQSIKCPKIKVKVTCPRQLNLVFE
jgi:hypothetical protein